jgi:hypothetical protein
LKFLVCDQGIYKEIAHENYTKDNCYFGSDLIHHGMLDVPPEVKLRVGMNGNVQINTIASSR